MTAVEESESKDRTVRNDRIYRRTHSAQLSIVPSAAASRAARALATASPPVAASDLCGRSPISSASIDAGIPLPSELLPSSRGYQSSHTTNAGRQAKLRFHCSSDL